MQNISSFPVVDSWTSFLSSHCSPLAVVNGYTGLGFVAMNIVQAPTKDVPGTRPTWHSHSSLTAKWYILIETILAYSVLSDGDSASVEKNESDDSPDDADKTSTGIRDHCRNYIYI